MSYADRWDALSKRIKAMIIAGRAALEHADAFGSVALVKDRSKQIVEAVKDFRASVGPVLTSEAMEYMDNFIAQTGTVHRAFEEGGTPEWRRELLSSILT